ncbi:ribosome biogenesis GTPase Der [uncultured Helicobacter sp.]|uniref:ribosome biogenesis GTPase Der n=2 Tax=uncultured Helicobacter sp. TaxID=175537 RepID=UPI0026069A3E|nr:ribosome biogenesis GTPase Der [uncultured Helicobacter sp.]
MIISHKDILMKSIAIVGKPNVGKSSLFNRLIKQQLAITSAISGTTRDVKKASFSISGVEVEIIDTGGLEKTQGLFAKVSEHSQKAALEADMILYMVDGSTIPQDDDIAYFRTLQKHKKPLMLVINKVDNDKIKQRAWDFNAFGTQDMCFISVQHNRGITSLLENIFDTLCLSKEQSVENQLREQFKQGEIDESLEEFLGILQEPQSEVNESICVGIIGRVNVGKSSLLNALVGKERSVVSEVAGTTIDPVDDEMHIEGKSIRFVDTAGIRRAGKIEGIEKFALLRTNPILSQSHIAILVLDVSEPFVELDEKISSLIPKYALGVIIVLNKWDKKYASFEEIKRAFTHRFPFLSFAPVITLSALSGRNIDKLKMEILKVYERFCYRIPTSTLNDVIARAISAHHIPSDHGKLVKIYYATQYDIKPPRIALISNRPKSLHFSYKRYLINILREHFDFTGVPLYLSVKSKQEDKDDKTSKTPKRYQRGDKNTRF